MSMASEEIQQEAVEVSDTKIPPIREDYIIYPIDEHNREEINKTHDAISQIVGPEIAFEQAWINILGQGGYPPWMEHWLVPLTEEQAAEVAKLEGVEGLKKDYLDPNYNFTNP